MTLPISQPAPRRRAGDRFGTERVISFVLLAGLLARAAVALWRSDGVWPDEQFQALEPAGHAIFGHGILSWEWTSAYRSWVIPALYMPLFWTAKLVGITGGIVLVHAARLLTALASSWALWRFAQALKLLMIHRRARLIAVAALALAPSMILWAPTTLADNWAQIAAVGILPAVIRQSRRLSTGYSLPGALFALGLLFGGCFLIKPQMAFWALGAGLATLLATRRARDLAPFSAGFGLGILAHGLVDWFSWGRPFATLIEQALHGERASRAFGTAPWHEYVSLYLKDQGVWLPALVGVGVAATLVCRGSARSWAKARSTPLAFVFGPPLAFSGFLLAVPHKELRYLLPVLPFVYLLAGVLLHAPLERLERWLPRTAPWRAGAALATFPLALLGARAALRTPLYLSSVDISRLEDRMYHLNGLFASHRSCVLLIEHNWAWTHGLLALGARVDQIEHPLADLRGESLEDCPFAVVPTRGEPAFELLTHDTWKRIDRADSGFTLFLNVNVGKRGLASP